MAASPCATPGTPAAREARDATMMLSCGDALVDFLPVKAVDGRDALVPAVGGSCLNVAVGLARLGVEAGFVGGISTALLSRMIARPPPAPPVALRLPTRRDHHTTPAFARTVSDQPRYAVSDQS